MLRSHDLRGPKQELVRSHEEKTEEVQVSRLRDDIAAHGYHENLERILYKDWP